MSLLKVRRLLVVIAPLVLLLASTTPALAADPVVLEIQTPKQVSLGDEIVVTVVLRDGSGAPIPATGIILWTGARFLSVGGAMELDRASTNAQGRATFNYQVRTEKSLTLNASFPGDGRYAFGQASAEVEVLGSAQLYQSTAGVRVGGIGVWLLAAVVGGVWATYFAVMVFLTLIVREGSKTPDEAGAADA